jgi:hypothetical protein
VVTRFGMGIMSAFSTCIASTSCFCARALPSPPTTGCVQFGGHRIAGLSGTYVSNHYHWGHHERLPYDERAVKSIYHVRQLEVHRLMQVGVCRHRKCIQSSYNTPAEREAKVLTLCVCGGGGVLVLARRRGGGLCPRVL